MTRDLRESDSISIPFQTGHQAQHGGVRLHGISWQEMAPARVARRRMVRQKVKNDSTEFTL